jgi:hypothetical protein
MSSQLIITVTSAEGRPRLALPPSTTTDQVREIVARSYGMNAAPGTWMRPHDFCGQIVPPPADQVERRTAPQAVPFLSQRGHLRAF